MQVNEVSTSLELARSFGISLFLDPFEPPRDAAHDVQVNSAAFSRDGGALFTASNDGTVSVFDASSGARQCDVFVRDGVGACLITPTHHAMGVLHAAVAHAPPRAAGRVTYHNLHENKVVRFFEGHERAVTAISMSPSSDVVLTAGLDGTFRLWDLRAAAPVARGDLVMPPKATEPPPAPHTSAALLRTLKPAAAFDAGGDVFAVVAPNGCLQLFDPRRLPPPGAGEAAPFWRGEYAPVGSYLSEPEKNNPNPYCANTSFTGLAFSPNNALIAISTLDRGVIIVDSFTPSKEYAVLAEHPIHLAHPSPAAWAPDSKTLLVGGADGHVWAYCTEVGAPGGLPDLSDLDFLPGAAEYPERPAAPPRLARQWTPAVAPQPAAALLGEAQKTPAARDAARDAARRYAEELLKKDMDKRIGAAKQGAQPSRGRFPEVVRTSIPPPPAPAGREEMAARMEGPVSALAWHPWAALVAAAGGGAGGPGAKPGGGRAALWALPGGARGGGGDTEMLARPVV